MDTGTKAARVASAGRILVCIALLPFVSSCRTTDSACIEHYTDIVSRVFLVCPEYVAKWGVDKTIQEYPGHDREWVAGCMREESLAVKFKRLERLLASAPNGGNVPIFLESQLCDAVVPPPVWPQGTLGNPFPEVPAGMVLYYYCRLLDLDPCWTANGLLLRQASRAPGVAPLR